MKKLYTMIVIGILLIPLNAIVLGSNSRAGLLTHFDPLENISVTVTIKTIRFLNVAELHTSTKARDHRNPSFYMKVLINGVEFTSLVWSHMKYVYDPQWSASLSVPDDEEFVNITLQLWSSSTDGTNDVQYDLSPNPKNYDVHLVYCIRTGHWTGDDAIGDVSGYGRLCGCDDGKIWGLDKNAELWFDITQTDYDSDGIPYWIEVTEYGTDPLVNDQGKDFNSDGIPIEWDWKWGYDPMKKDGHEKLDPDNDSINNYEEFLTSQWFSDPFRKDIFVEMDIMGDGPNGEKTYFPENSKELITTAFNKQNIVYHLDMGSMGGFESIPFDAHIAGWDLNRIYQNYFLHGDNNNWRRGVFHYGLVTYNATPPGYAFRSNAFLIASYGLEKKPKTWIVLDREIVYASAYMHELGHTFNIWPIPGHEESSVGPWQLDWWKNRPYKSCMNYAWVFEIVDYSDGLRRSPDLNDWNRIDYAAFEQQ